MGPPERMKFKRTPQQEHFRIGFFDNHGIANHVYSSSHPPLGLRIPV
jgi:hypothetical protein